MKHHFQFLLLFTAVALTGCLADESTPPAREARVMHFDLDWNVAGGLPEKAMLVSLQGLANREAPQLYIIHPPDFQWEITEPLYEFYQRKHDVTFTEIETAEEALALFSGSARGYVIWDTTVGASQTLSIQVSLTEGQ